MLEESAHLPRTQVREQTPQRRLADDPWEASAQQRHETPERASENSKLRDFNHE